MSERSPINPELLDWYQEQDEVVFDVVPHSHLDYAWYRDRESSKMREVEAFVKTLEVQNFTLEQMITAKEFIEGGGERLRESLLEMVRTKRMELIDMYSQPDIFLSPQELRMWNYKFGEEIVKKLGGTPNNFEYLPDTFGGDENTPMVIREAGKEAIITMRGDAENLPLTWWESPDGSRILRILMQGGYANVGGLTELHGVNRETTPPDEYFEKQVQNATKRILMHIEYYGPRYKQVGMPHALLMNGNDFTKPDQDLPKVLEEVENRIREWMPNFSIKTSSLGAYVTRALSTLDAEKVPVFKGEMRSGREHFVLRGIDSARMYLKQQMHNVSTRIYDAGATVSLLVLARNAGLVSENEHASWQQVVAYNRAIEQILPVGSHDTVSGCGSDDAYPLPLSLLNGSYNSANQASRNAMAALSNRHDGYGAYQHKEHGQTFANLLPYDRTVVVELPMQGNIERERGLRAIATYSDGRQVTLPVQIFQKIDSRYGLCTVPIESMSSVQVRLESTDGNAFETHEPESNNFENDNYLLDIQPDGTLAITDKRTGTTMKGLVFEDQGDRGDEYTYCYVDGDTVRTTENGEARISVVNDGPVFTELQIDTQLEVPEGLDGPQGNNREVRTRSSNMVVVPISTRVRMYKDPSIDRIEFATTVNNTARDHRLRVRFDTPNAGQTVRAKEPYGMTERPIVPIHGGQGWMEPLPISTSHNQGIVTAGETALFNKGLAEYEAIPDEEGNVNQIALTLFRSVGYLSRGNLTTRPGFAGPGISTPDAQMIGSNTYEYAVSFGGQKTAGDVIADSKDYFHKAEQGFAGANINDIVKIKSSIAIEQSTLSPTFEGDAVILRLANPNDEPAVVDLDGVFSSALRSGYDGTVEDESTAADMHHFSIPPRGMVTVRLK